MANTILIKYSAESGLYDFDLTALLAGRTIASVTSLTSPGLTIGSPVINGSPITYPDGVVAPALSVIQATISGGTAGTFYDIRGTYFDSAAATKVFDAILEVKA